jgi:selenocysteine lyase/cysteine desulfurase
MAVDVPPLAPRSDFPVLRELTYLNTASIGLVPLPVQFEAQQIEREIAVRGTTWFDEEIETGVLERARKGAATLLATSPELIAVTSSATEALSQVAWAVRPPAGANVVTADIEFPSVTYPWFRVCAESGAEVRVARHDGDPGALSIDSLATLVDDQTAAIAVSHVQYSTGHRLDLAELTQLAQAHDALLVIDATQSAGHAPIDLSAPGVHVDALVAGGYKWLCGPFGAAVCYLDPQLLERLEPAFVGWRSAPEPYAMDASRLSLARDARKLEFSTMSYSAAVGLGAAIEYVLGLDVEDVLRHDQLLADRLATGLEQLGATVLGRDGAAGGGTVTVRFPEQDGAVLADWLNRSGVVVSPRAGLTRYAAHFFNSSEDIDRAVRTTAEVLQLRSPVPDAGERIIDAVRPA